MRVERSKKLFLILLAVVMMFSFAACGSIDSGDAESTDTHIIVDHAGNEVEIPNDVQRVVVCDIYPLPSVLSVFFDSADKIVGMSDASMSAAQNSLLSELYPEILNAKTDFINGTDVNIEELALLEPDVVFYSATTMELGDKLKNAGFNAVGISANKWEYDAIETLKNWISLLGEIFPENDKYEKVSEYSNSVYDMVQSRVKDIPVEDKVKVFFLFQYNEKMMMTSGKQFFGQYWADASGAVNAAEELRTDNSVAVGMEQVLAWNPELIFITNFNPYQPEDLYNNTVGNYDWSGIEAVENKRVYKMPLGMYRSYTAGVDTPVTLFWMAKTIYPELFEDVDITAETQKYYKEVFGIDLTAEQADMIFNPASDAGKGV